MKRRPGPLAIARTLAAATLLAVLPACATAPDDARYRPSDIAAPLPAAERPFDAYVRTADAYLAQARVLHDPVDPDWELRANAPFEFAPDPARCATDGTRPERGILLIHGLSDSPYTFRGLARDLAERCFLVRGVLLPGHGTRPGDMLQANHDDWRATADAAFRQLRRDVEHAYVGGFSMGATLATLLALEHDDVAGLALFSPAYADDEDLIWLAKYLAPFVSWLDVDQEDNAVKYEAFPTQAAAAYARLTEALAQRLDGQTFEIPVFMALSTDDSVIDGRLAVRTFAERMPHPRSTLHVYTRPETRFDLPDGDRVRTFESARPGDRITNFSHMAPPFAPDDPYYGRTGRYVHCTSYEELDAYRHCRATPREALWYGSHDAQDGAEDRVVARLTYNPYYGDAVEAIDATLRPDGDGDGGAATALR